MGEGVEVELKPLRSRRLSGKTIVDGLVFFLTAEAQRTRRNAWWKGAGGRWKSEDFEFLIFDFGWVGRWKSGSRVAGHA